MSSPRRTASRLQDNPALAFVARAGFAVNGVLHLLIGGIAISVAFGAGGEADQSGALGALAQNPFGFVMLWVIVVGMWGLAAFQILEAVVVRGADADAWKERASEAGKGVAYLAIGVTAFSFAVGGSSDSSSKTRSLTADLLAAPAGVVLVLAIALAVIAIGVYFVVKGVRQKFTEDITMPPPPADRATRAIGTVGYCAKGIAIVVVGVLFGVAAVTADPSQASGLDGALKALVALPFGVIVLLGVAVGLIAYGVYCFVRARYAKM